MAAFKTAREVAEAGRQISQHTIALGEIADLRHQLGRLNQAERLYRTTVSFFRNEAHRLGTPEAQRDPSVSLNKIGDLTRDRGDLAAALDAFQESLKIRRDLVTQLDTSKARRDLTISLYNMTRVTLGTSDKDQARAFYDGGLALIDRLHPDHQAEMREAFAKLDGAFD